MDDSCSRPQDARRTSDVLRDFLQHTGDPRVSLGELITAMGDRAYGVLLLLFALPNMLPIGVPGMTAVFGAPLILFSAQLAIGLPAPWVPVWLANRSISHEHLSRVIGRSLPYLEQAERLLRPRWLVFTGSLGERVIGFVCFVLGLVIALPIPLGNILPAAAVAVLAIAILERDGAAAIAGHLVAAISLIIVSVVVIAIVEALFFFLGRAFS
ncbi:MAG TPA: exopolysaccharide biosynthesis protein [Alphaproteobacteria bacterium]|nr:exopolysaccharide biosynthesis protein [Alphaproteobacteria bacterium]